MVRRAAKGNALHLFAVREIEADCLCLRGQKKGDREYKAVITVDPLNFGLMSEAEQETILAGFRVFLHRLPAHQPIAIHVRIEPFDLEPYFAQLRNAAQTDPSLAVREMAADHEQFVRQLASQRALLQRRFYVIVGADRSSASGKRHSRLEEFDQARSQLDLRTRDMLQDLERIGLSGHRLPTHELRLYYQSCLHTRAGQAYPLPASNGEDASQVLRPAQGHAANQDLPETGEGSAISAETDVSRTATPQRPDGFWRKGFSGAIRKMRLLFSGGAPHGEEPGEVALAELLAPSSVEIFRNYLRLHRYGDELVRGMAVIGYPATVSAGWLDRLIQIDEPCIDLMMYIETLESSRYVSRLSRKLTGFRATQQLEERRGRTADPWIKAARAEVEKLRDDLVNQQEQVHAVSLYLLLRATSQVELRERSQKVFSLLRSLELTAVECSFEHQKVYQCCLPDARDVLKRRKIMDTSSLVTGFPFASSSLSTATGILVGVQPNGSLVIMDPASESLENGHEVKFARSGAGKSYDEKTRLARSLYAGYDCIVIDPEDEYTRLRKRYSGTGIQLSPGALQLNPFDLSPSEDERNLLEEKLQSLHTLEDLLLAEKEVGTISQKEKAYLHKCYVRLYARCNITADPATYTQTPPCMEDLFEMLRREECGPDSFGLAERLERHVASFPEQTVLGLEDQRLVVFNIRDLDADLKAVGLFLIADFVWTQIRRERHPRKRLLVIDEAWTLLQFPEGGRFLASLARRARKYNLSLRITSQDVDDFIANEYGRTIIRQAAMKMLMKQDATTIDAVTKAFHLSEGERKYLLGCGKGEGLFFARSSHVPIKVVASPAEHRLATTNPQELLREEMPALAPESGQGTVATTFRLASADGVVSSHLQNGHAPAIDVPRAEERG